ncbi:6829_t:CDS:2 [Funneliformis geosporum]|nr:6829_t:CDS:2 [Funneliformis geosporum]
MYYEEEIKPKNPAVARAKKAKKQKQATVLIALVLIGGLTYYFFGYLPEERQRTKEEIEQILLLPSQVKTFKEKMLKAIELKAAELEQEEIDKPRKMREEAVKNIESSLEKEEKGLPDIQKIIEKFTEKVNNTPLNDLSSVIEKANNLILEKRYKRKRLY